MFCIIACISEYVKFIIARKTDEEEILCWIMESENAALLENETDK